MPFSTDTISIRMATPDDSYALMRLAQLDSSLLPAGPVLLAEREEQLQAALSLRDGLAISDPFGRNAELVALLRLRASRIRPRVRGAARMRGAISSRRHSRAYAA
jgi:hypothetical protein